MNNENTIRQSREYIELVAERLYEELPNKQVKIVRAARLTAENDEVVFLIETVVDGRKLVHFGDNAFKTIDNLVAEARAGKPIGEIVEPAT